MSYRDATLALCIAVVTGKIRLKIICGRKIYEQVQNTSVINIMILHLANIKDEYLQKPS